jgi:division protein CdvB (Snf7/Vps24/ESCRT-III family)
MDSQERFQRLKSKYAPVLRVLDQSQARIQEMDVQNDRLMIRAAVSSTDLRDRVLDEIARLDESLSEVIPDIRVEGRPNVPTTGQTTVNTSQDFSQQGRTAPGEEQRKAR